MYQGAGYIGSSEHLIYLSDGTVVSWRTNAEKTNPVKAIAHKQRRLFMHPDLKILGTVLGTYDTYRKHFVPTPADGFEVSLNIDNGRAILDAVAMPGGLFIFTDTTVMQSPGEQVLTPTNFSLENLQLPGIYKPLSPIKTQDNLLYVDSSGSKARAVKQRQQKSVYDSAELTSLTDLLNKPKGWCYANDIIWVAQKADLLSCTYHPEQEVLAWMSHESVGGSFEDTNAVYSEVYFSVKREDQWHLEMFADEDTTETDMQYSTPYIELLPFRVMDSPVGQGQVEFQLSKSMQIRAVHIRLVDEPITDEDLSVEIFDDPSSGVGLVPLKLVGVPRIVVTDFGAIDQAPFVDPIIKIIGANTFNSIQILVDAEINPLPVIREGGV